MLFGIPWFALIPIAAIVGGLFLAYRKQELEFEVRARDNSLEVQELRKIVQNLKSRVESLESIAADSDLKRTKKDVPLDDIEVKDDYYPSEDNTNQPNRVKN